ncbi:hypothetical protein CUN61_19520 [Pseudomonas arsenicoxydans]|uniref:Uncharacterized protein n=1 Tax=Pseudomonas arsenicoxydans TaxID=702115 RepID=A0A4P6G5S9_9PSED|nr:hypothetical protein CUN61_19520 [Pseudomonas arsenicoxydans]
MYIDEDPATTTAASEHFTGLKRLNDRLFVPWLALNRTKLLIKTSISFKREAHGHIASNQQVNFASFWLREC